MRIKDEKFMPREQSEGVNPTPGAMKKSRIIFPILAILFGVFMFIYGGYDDSLGAQGLGLLAIVVGIVVIVRSKKKISN
jgi:hypothetical protein